MGVPSRVAGTVAILRSRGSSGRVTTSRKPLYTLAAIQPCALAPGSGACPAYIREKTTSGLPRARRAAELAASRIDVPAPHLFERGEEFALLVHHGRRARHAGTGDRTRS